MSDWIDEVIRLLLDSSFLSLATTDRDGRPWVTPVEFACEDALRFYWTSHHDARHSRNVRANPRAAMTIFDSTQVPGVRAEAIPPQADAVRWRARGGGARTSNRAHRGPLPTRL